MGIFGRNGFGNDSHSVFVLNGEEVVTGSTFPNLAYSYSGITTNYGAVKDAFAKFGAYSWFFDSAYSASMYTPWSAGWNFGVKDFTIDFWIRFFSLGVSYQGVIGNQYYDNGFVLRYRTSPYGLQFFDVNGANVAIPQSSLSASVFVHCVFVRKGTTTYAFANGILQDTDSSSASISSNEDLTTGVVWFQDYADQGSFRIDGLRMSAGIARWTSRFTPPARSY